MNVDDKMTEYYIETERKVESNYYLYVKEIKKNIEEICKGMKHSDVHENIYMFLEVFYTYEAKEIKRLGLLERGIPDDEQLIVSEYIRGEMIKEYFEEEIYHEVMSDFYRDCEVERKNDIVKYERQSIGDIIEGW